MAKIPQGILGGISGRVGNVVGGDWKGINYIRSMPLSVANPNTALQQAQRGAFSSVVSVARLLLADLVATYWDPFARAMSGYNSFIKQNIAAFDTAGFDDPTIFSAGRGILTGVLNLACTAGEGAGSLAFTWDDNDGVGDALAADEGLFLWYNVTQDYWNFDGVSLSDRASASGGKADTRILESDVLEVYMFFRRTDISKISDSSHVQVIVAA